MPKKAGIVIRDAILRSQLRQMLDAIEVIDTVATFTDLQDCFNVIKGGAHFDVLILEHSVAQTNQVDFITMVKAQPKGRTTTFICAVPVSKQTSQTLTDKLLLGFHNILCEPYSIASIEEILGVGESMRAQSSMIRLNIAAHLIIADAMGALDQEKQTPGNSLATNVKNSCEKFCKETGVSVTGYFKQFASKLHAATPHELINYTGASKRVRQNIIARLRGLKN